MDASVSGIETTRDSLCLYRGDYGGGNWSPEGRTTFLNLVVSREFFAWGGVKKFRSVDMNFRSYFARFDGDLIPRSGNEPIGE